MNFTLTYKHFILMICEISTRCPPFQSLQYLLDGLILVVTSHDGNILLSKTPSHVTLSVSATLVRAEERADNDQTYSVAEVSSRGGGRIKCADICGSSHSGLAIKCSVYKSDQITVQKVRIVTLALTQ